MKKNKKICIFGAGGFGRETLLSLKDSISDINIEESVCFMVEDEYFFEKELMGISVVSFSDFNPEVYDVVIAVGDPIKRSSIVAKLPKETSFTSIIHPTAIIPPETKIGEGSIISAGVILTSNITIGCHTHLNLNTTIGHDCKVGDYFTTAPGVNISGNCSIGNYVYIGTNACVREKLNICDYVTVGMGSVLVKNISKKGTYVGNPIKKLN